MSPPFDVRVLTGGIEGEAGVHWSWAKWLFDQEGHLIREPPDTPSRRRALWELLRYLYSEMTTEYGFPFVCPYLPDFLIEENLTWLYELMEVIVKHTEFYAPERNGSFWYPDYWRKK